MIEIFTAIHELLGPVEFWLREEIRRRIEFRVIQVTGKVAVLEIEGGRCCFYIPDNDEIRFWIRQAIIEAVTNSNQVKPIWGSYSAKLKILKPLKLDNHDRKALKKACIAQSQPYRQRALEWLVSLDCRSSFLASLKTQAIKWLDDQEAGNKTHVNPLSESQMEALMKNCFNCNSDRPEDWLPPATAFEEKEVFDPWTGERTKVQVPKWETNLTRLQKQYHEATSAAAGRQS